MCNSPWLISQAVLARLAVGLIPWQIGKPFLSAVHVHPPVFRAPVQRRHRLPGIEQPMLVESALDAMEGFELGGLELHAHRVDLFNTDAVLAGDRAAYLKAQLEDLGAEGFRALELARLVRVVKDERMQVAVPRVEHVGAAQAVLGFELRDLAEHLAEALAR